MYSRILFFNLCILYTSLSYGQYFEAGQDPSFIKWRQIKSENFQIIFPTGFENESQRLANSLDKVYHYATYTLKVEPKRISVILHSYSALSNAFVAWAPKRAELYTIPPQDNYPQDWLNQLAIHEYRHVVQISKLNQGFTEIVSIILGQQGTAAVLGLFVPLWFLEGDAVAAETALSNTGRGRIPSFEMQLRTQVLGTKIYSYEKSYFGSYRDFVTDYYKMGYYLVAYGRSKYGYQLWDSTINYVARNPYFPTPFSKGIKRVTGQSKWKFYKTAFRELDTLWTKQKEQLNYTSYTAINNPSKKVYTSYRYPQTVNDSSWIVLKNGLGDIDEFVLLDKEGNEKHLFTPGYISPVWLSANENYIVWPEYGFDKRWENRLYSDIIIYDIKEKKRRRLTRNRFLFSPSLSPDASKIVAVEVEFGNKYSFAIIETKSGKLIERIPSPDNKFILTPTWSDDGKAIVYCSLSDSGKSIERYTVEEKRHETILNSGFAEVTQPLQSGSYIYFHGTWSGIDNIYAIDILSRQTYQITSSVYGAFDPCLSKDGKSLIYADYSPLGYNTVKADLDKKNWIPLDSVSNTSIKLYESFVKEEKGVIEFDTVNQTSYAIKPYRKLPHLFYLHSWAPVYIDIDNTNLSPGVSLLSQNKLSTMAATIGYRFDYNEGTSRINSTLSYKALYPVIDMDVSSDFRRSASIDSSGKKEYTWRENGITLGVSQTLNLTRGKYRRALYGNVSFSYKDVFGAADVPTNFYVGRLSLVKTNLSAYRYLKMAKRDVRPRWGQSIQFYYYTGLESRFKIRDLYAGEAMFYFPGIWKHHSLRGSLSYQEQSSGLLNFSSPVASVRGYSTILNATTFKGASIDYKLPIAYPDWKLGPFVYIQRVKLNLFYDYAYATYTNFRVEYQSAGAELTSDLNLFNFVAPIDIGFRWNYLLPSQNMNVQLLIGVGLP